MVVLNPLASSVRSVAATDDCEADAVCLVKLMLAVAISEPLYASTSAGTVGFPSFGAVYVASHLPAPSEVATEIVPPAPATDRSGVGPFPDNLTFAASKYCKVTFVVLKPFASNDDAVGEKVDLIDDGVWSTKVTIAELPIGVPLTVALIVTGPVGLLDNGVYVAVHLPKPFDVAAVIVPMPDEGLKVNIGAGPLATKFPFMESFN